MKLNENQLHNGYKDMFAVWYTRTSLQQQTSDATQMHDSRLQQVSTRTLNCQSSW
jgi:hypothetical protein